MSTAQKRAVAQVLEERGRSERTACSRVHLHRSTKRYQPKQDPDELQLVVQLRAIADRHPGYGSPRAHMTLRFNGVAINHKRVERLWAQEGLQIPRRKPKRRRQRSEPWPDRASCKNHVWTIDFLHHRTLDGRRIKVLSVLDEYTRECLALEVERRLRGPDVVRVFESIVRERTSPAFVRSDNGPEFISVALAGWAHRAQTGLRFIQPGSPWQNGCVESFHGKLRKECLDRELFVSRAEARVILAAWRRYYNQERLHSSLGYLPPAVFAARPSGANFAPLRLPLKGDSPADLSP